MSVHGGSGTDKAPASWAYSHAGSVTVAARWPLVARTHPVKVQRATIRVGKSMALSINSCQIVARIAIDRRVTLALALTGRFTEQGYE